MGKVVKANEECYEMFGKDLDGCSTQQNEGCGRCNLSKKYMECDICHKEVLPLDAHMGKMDGKLITAHIDCWNKAIKENK